MSASAYCSDCAWPYECAAAQACRRRDRREVRGESLAVCSALLSGARCARPDAPAPARSLVAAPDRNGHEQGEGAPAAGRAHRTPANSRGHVK